MEEAVVFFLAGSILGLTICVLVHVMIIVFKNYEE